MRSRLVVALLLLYCSIPLLSIAQDKQDESPQPSAKDASKYIKVVSKKSASASADIDKQTEKYLTKLQRQEVKLKKKLAKIDSIAANNIFASSAPKYQKLQDDIKNRSEKLRKSTGKYVPFLDTSISSLKFLEANQLAGKLPVNPAQIKDALAKVGDLKNQLQQAENIKQFIRERKEYLKAKLAKYNLGKDLQKFNKDAYYYSQQINDYKAILDDPSKIEQKALSLLRHVPAFKKFMNEHGLLVGLFNVPADYATNMNGLQTIQQVQGVMQNRMASLGPNPQQYIQQNISAAQSQLAELRKKFPQLGEPGDIPDFKPDKQKTKTFLQRLEIGTNMQTVRSNNFFPTTSDIGVSVGYRLNDKSVIGIGTSYKMGWGKDIRHISVSHQGIGLRTFADFKLKKSFWITGGGELNYRSDFKNFDVLNDFTPWQKSALLGLSKTVSLKAKFFKSTKVQLLYDFLHKQQTPQTNAVIFRVGYSFK